MPHIEIAAEKLFSLWGMPFTNTLIASWIVTGGLIIVARLLARTVQLVPTGVQNVFEFVIEKFLGVMETLFGSRKAAEKYLPLVVTAFLFILLSNWFGIFPGVGSIGFLEKRGGETLFVPLLRSAASDLNVTLALATVTVFAIHLSAVSALGLRAHLSKFLSFKGPIEFFVGILELISEFAKIVSFSFRLFGNIFAGEVLLVVTSSLVPFMAPIPFLMLELFVGFIQALVFAMLTMVFLSIAVTHD